MDHEEYLKEKFQKYKIIGILASNGKLWEDLAFYINIFLNFLILTSYSELNLKNSIYELNEDQQEEELQKERIDNPRFWFKESNDWTPDIIFLFGLINLVFSGLVVFFILIKRGPLKV